MHFIKSIAAGKIKMLQYVVDPRPADFNYIVKKQVCVRSNIMNKM